MSKVINTLDNIIRNAGWAKNYASLDDATKYKRITGIVWVNDGILEDAANEDKLLWLISGGGDFLKIAGDEPVRPDVVPNTPEQDALEQNIIEQINAGTKSISIPDGQTANNLTIPETNTNAITITGDFQDGATISNLSNKGITLNNTSSDGIPSIVVDSQGGVVTLKGQFNQVYANTKTIGASGAKVNEVVFGREVEGIGDLSVGADWVDPVTITSFNTNNLTIRNNSDTTVLEHLDIVAPNATVTLYGQWDEVMSNVGDDTLVIDGAAHINKLVVKTGNVLVHSYDINKCIGEIVVPEQYTVKPFEYDIAETASLVKGGGLYKLDDGEVVADGIFGILMSGDYKYINNGHIKAKSKNAALHMRPAVNVVIDGNGVWENAEGYCIWKSNNNGITEIHGGVFNGQTHVIYAEKGFIDIYGGEFELINTEDKKYLLNCLDANYQAGTAGIHVYGGKFHDFDPANSMSEPGAPVSFVVRGYKSVQTAENVWEVFPEDANVDPWTPEE